MKIALIGAGPRNLILLKNLVDSYKSNEPKNKLFIQMFDSSGISGRVWNPNQHNALTMNSLAIKTTLYNESDKDYSPSLLHWMHIFGLEYLKHIEIQNKDLIKKELENIHNNHYASRAMFGLYQQWFYEQIIHHLPNNITVKFYKENIDNIIYKENTYEIVTNSKIYFTNQIIISTGQGDNNLTESETKLYEFATKNGLTYITVGYANENYIDDIESTENVIIKGMGLSFIDYVSELTERRGGIFKRNSLGDLVYIPSGEEPHIFAGSRSGIPYKTKSFDQKQPGETFDSVFLTYDLINSLEKSNHKLTEEKFMSLLEKEINLSYYTQILKNNNLDTSEFKQDFISNSDHFKKILHKYKLDIPILDIDKLIKPIPSNVNSTSSFVEFIKKYIQNDIIDAKQGNKTNPLRHALDQLHDLKPIIKKMVAKQLFDNDFYVNVFLKKFNHINNFLTVGAPIFRMEQLVALINSNILTLIGPGMKVEQDQSMFVAYSQKYNDKKYYASILIEGRTPTFDAHNTRNILIKNLMSNHMAIEYKVKLSNNEIYNTKALNVNDNFQIIDSNNTYYNVYAWGLPTEQKFWFTNAAPIYGMNDSIFSDSEIITKNILNNN